MSKPCDKESHESDWGICLETEIVLAIVEHKFAVGIIIISQDKSIQDNVC